MMPGMDLICRAAQIMCQKRLLAIAWYCSTLFKLGTCAPWFDLTSTSI